MLRMWGLESRSKDEYMTDQAVLETGAVEEAAPVVPEATEAVEPVVPTEESAAAAGDPGDTAQQPMTKREVRAQLVEDRERASRESSVQRQKEAADGAAEETPTEAAAAGEEGVDGEPVVDVHGREHDPNSGEYVAAATAEGETPAETPAEEAAEAAPEAEETQVAPTISVTLPDDHPVAESMGGRPIETMDEKSAEAVRALMAGTYSRHADVKARDNEILVLREKLAERNETIVRREAKEAAAVQFEASPAYIRHKAKYLEIVEMVDQESASAYWNSDHVQQDVKPIEEAEFESRMAPVREEAANADGERWVGDALRAAQATVPADITQMPAFQQVFDSTVATFDAEFKAKMHGDLDTPEKAHAFFSERLNKQLVEEPTIKAFLKARMDAKASSEAETATQAEEAQKRAQAATIKAAEDAAVEKARQVAADARSASPPHPLAAVADANRGNDASGSVSASPPQDGVDTDKMTPHQLKQHFRKLSRGDARARATSSNQ